MANLTEVAVYNSPSFTSSCCVDGTTIDRLSNNNWGPLSYYDEAGALVSSAEATSTRLLAETAWLDTPTPGRLTNETLISREGAFRVSGSGNVTFSIDYSLVANRLVDSLAMPYPGVDTKGVAVAEMLFYIPYVRSFDSDSSQARLNIAGGSANHSVSKNGTLTVIAKVTDGTTYWVRAQGSSIGSVQVPEPSALVLLGMGLMGTSLAVRRQRIRDERA